MLESFFRLITQTSLSTSLIVAVLLLLFPFINRRYSAKWRYFVWLIIALRLIFPFDIKTENKPININIPANYIESISQADHQSAVYLTSDKNETQSNNKIDFKKTISFIWAVGFVLFIIYHIGGYFIFLKNIRRYSKPADEKINSLWRLVKNEARVSKNIRVLVCKKIKSPMMTGFFKPILLLPEQEFDGNDLPVILKHELIHYKRKDVWYKLTLIFANALHWFNPLIYLMVYAADRDVEIVCDSEVIKNADIDYKKRYSEAILKAVSKNSAHSPALSTYFYGGKSILKERFKNIFNINKKKKGILALCAVIIIISIFGVSVVYGDNAETKTTINNSFKAYSTDLYSLSAPASWNVEAAFDGTVSFKKDSEDQGSLSVLNYDPTLPISQFEGNHAETLSTKKLDGLRYPATETVIRRTKPAAAMDDSYVDELHVYLIPENSAFAYDLSFDSSKADEKTVLEIAKSVIIKEGASEKIKDNEAKFMVAGKWAQAVKDRQGRAQYDLLSNSLKSSKKQWYEDMGWVTGTSSPWVENYSLIASDGGIKIIYEYATSAGPEGKYEQMLHFIKEGGEMRIGSFSEPKKIS
ncbi:MAG: M56 family metallopeptidase [Bacillota bacterium]|nr:M56 family metallopeptidase [Bacillota bacterium]